MSSRIRLHQPTGHSLKAVPFTVSPCVLLPLPGIPTPLSIWALFLESVVLVCLNVLASLLSPSFPAELIALLAGILCALHILLLQYFLRCVVVGFRVHFPPYLTARDRCQSDTWLSFYRMAVEKITLGWFSSQSYLVPFLLTHFSFWFNSRARRRENYAQFSKTRTLKINSKKTK